MSLRARRFVTLVVLLSAATVAAWVIRVEQTAMGTGNSAYLLVADIDTWRRTGRERMVSTPFDLRVTADLTALPTQIGRWHALSGAPADPEVLAALNPDAYLVRAFQREGGRTVWLSLVASRRLESFHLPHVCYQGWSTTLRSEAIPLQGGELYAFSMLAQKAGKVHLLYYFYLWPGRERRMEDGLTMFKVTADVKGTEQETRTWLREFISLWFDRAWES